MKRTIFLIFSVMGLLGAVSACNEGVTTPTGSPGAQIMRNKIAAGETGYDDPVLHAQLEDIWNGNTGGIHMLATQRINRETGGTLAVTPSGWPAGYQVRLEVPPCAFDSSYGDNLLFGISIPYDGDSSQGSPSYEFFPDGIQFAYPVKVTLCWPPWAGDPPSDVFELLFVESEIQEGARHYRVAESHTTSPKALYGVEPDGGWTLAQRSTEITFELFHFSRWGITSGSDDGGDKSGSGLQVGDACWTSFPPAEGGPTPMLR